MPSMAFAIKVHARLPFGPAHTGFLSRRRRLRFMLRTDQLPPPEPREVLLLRFDPGLSTDAGSRATRDPGVSPDRTLTGRLP